MRERVAVAAIAAGFLTVGCGGGGRAVVPDAGSDASDAGAVVACGQSPAGWTQRIAAGTSQPPRPPATWHAVMAPDLVHGEVLFFGGEVQHGSTYLDEAWTWNGATGTWTNRTPTPRPASWPSARCEQRMVWDPVRKTILMFGGLTEASPVQSDELWEWDGGAGTWTNLSPTPRPAAWPEYRYSHMLAYDEARGRLVLFGGIGPLSWPGYAGDLWEWSSADGSWKDRTPSTLPTDWPAPRQSAGMAYDGPSGKVLLFGGWNNDVLGDFWTWDGAAGAWTQVTSSSSSAWPPSGEWETMVFDACLGQATLVGGDGLVNNGTGAGNLPPQLWSWSSAAGAWTNLAPSPLPSNWPPAREVPAVAWDPGTLQILLVGGDPFGADPIDDTWTWETQ
ncbi:MAG TPA: hypothetical protein VKZ18_13745 [Polyangia bacterium]|nr:hypothetical protein [Polyangia bacterium]